MRVRLLDSEQTSPHALEKLVTGHIREHCSLKPKDEPPRRGRPGKDPCQEAERHENRDGEQHWHPQADDRLDRDAPRQRIHQLVSETKRLAEDDRQHDDRRKK